MESRCFSYSGKKKNIDIYVGVIIVVIMAVVAVSIVVLELDVLSTVFISMVIASPFMVFYYKEMFVGRSCIYLDSEGQFFLVSYMMSRELNKQIYENSARSLFIRTPIRTTQLARQSLDEAKQLAEKAKDIDTAAYYVDRFKCGLIDYDNMGGEAKVTRLDGFRLVRMGRTSCTYEYYDGSKRRKITLPNDFSGLKEYMEKWMR